MNTDTNTTRTEAFEDTSDRENTESISFAPDERGSGETVATAAAASTAGSAQAASTSDSSTDDGGEECEFLEGPSDSSGRSAAAGSEMRFRPFQKYDDELDRRHEQKYRQNHPAEYLDEYLDTEEAEEPERSGSIDETRIRRDGENREESLEESYFEGECEDDDPVLVYDVPRPALTIEEAATILGKSVRAVERGITGKWGNRLPEGWKARRMKIDGDLEWRIIPPPSFRIRHSNIARTPRKAHPQPVTPERDNDPAREEKKDLKDTVDNVFGFSLNSLIQSAGKKAKNEIVRAAEYALDNGKMEHPTIVIDRSDEVEKLLRELMEVQRELNEERRLHMEDLRMLAQLQGSMRLLEVNASQTSTLKEELALATQALREHKRQYQDFLALPWWKRLFKKAP